jgi:basic amino acid/polyamine antiporter, APA family
MSNASAQPRRLGLNTCAALMVGNIVGAGIFLTPAVVAKASPDVATYLGLWVVGALIAIAGAMVVTELGTLYPRAGGDYVFLDKAFGRSVAYAWGILSIFATFAGSIATLAVGAGDTLAQTSFGAGFAAPVFSVGSWTVTGGTLFAVALVWLTTLANCRSVRLVGWLQGLLTWGPIAAYTLIGIAVLAAGPAEAAASAPAATEATGGGALTAAFCAVFFTYSGWNVLTYVGGEIRSPSTTIPRAILFGMAATLTIYVLLNVAFVGTLSLETIAATPNVGVAVALQLFGDVGADVFALIMTVAILAGLNVTVMAGSRIFLAMAADGFISTRISALDPKRGTPVRALLLQATWTTLPVLTGSFAWLVTMTGSVMILLSCLTIAALFVLRARGAKAPYQTWGYPWLPAAYVATGLAVLAVSMFDEGSTLAMGTGAFLVLVLTHAAWQRLQSARAIGQRVRTADMISQVHGGPNLS